MKKTLIILIICVFTLFSFTSLSKADTVQDGSVLPPTAHIQQPTTQNNVNEQKVAYPQNHQETSNQGMSATHILLLMGISLGIGLIVIAAVSVA